MINMEPGALCTFLQDRYQVLQQPFLFLLFRFHRGGEIMFSRRLSRKWHPEIGTQVLLTPKFINYFHYSTDSLPRVANNS